MASPKERDEKKSNNNEENRKNVVNMFRRMFDYQMVHNHINMEANTRLTTCHCLTGCLADRCNRSSSDLLLLCTRLFLVR